MYSTDSVALPVTGGVLAVGASYFEFVWLGVTLLVIGSVLFGITRLFISERRVG